MGRYVSDQRTPQSVYGQGDEPDPRFSLANERTALAWMRTALALVAAGIAIISISGLAIMPRWTALIGAASCVGGAVLAWWAVARWERVERALRQGAAAAAARPGHPRRRRYRAGHLMLVLSVFELSRR